MIRCPEKICRLKNINWMAKAHASSAPKNLVFLFLVLYIDHFSKHFKHQISAQTYSPNSITLKRDPDKFEMSTNIKSIWKKSESSQFSDCLHTCFSIREKHSSMDLNNFLFQFEFANFHFVLIPRWWDLQYHLSDASLGALIVMKKQHIKSKISYEHANKTEEKIKKEINIFNWINNQVTSTARCRSISIPCTFFL